MQTKGQRRRAQREPGNLSVIRIELKDGMGNPRWVTADLVDVIDGGCGLTLMTMLKSGSKVYVRGRLSSGRIVDRLEAGVRWSAESPDGRFRAGLEFLDGHDDYESRQAEPPADVFPDTDALDCYEVMQLSPNADQDTIARVYRMLALRFHPDNTETGNRETFLRLAAAHRMLSDPERRAQYDIAYRRTKKLQWKIFDQSSTWTGTEAEKRKRQGILSLLYSKMLHDPEQAEVSLQFMEELLGCPREHLQAALWYLKGKNFITRGDSGRYSITVAGFEEAEARQDAECAGGSGNGARLRLTHA